MFRTPNPNDYVTLEKQLSFVLDNSKSIKFNLDGIDDIQDAIRLGSEGIDVQRIVNGLQQGNVTNFELFKIFESNALLRKTIFFRNGREVDVL